MGISCIAISVTLAILLYNAWRDIGAKWISSIAGLLIPSWAITRVLDVTAPGWPSYWFGVGLEVVTALAAFTVACKLPFIVGGVRAILRNAKLVTQLQLEVASANRRLNEQGRFAARREDSREGQFRFLADFMPQIVWTAKPDGSIDYYNKRWYELTGDIREESRYAREGDQSWDFVLHKDDLARCMTRWYEAVRSGEAYDIEYRLLDHRTGHYRWFLGRALPMRDEQGRIVRWFGTCTDIEEQKQVERELREIRAELEERVEHRTADLRNVNASLTRQMSERQRVEEVLQRQTGVLQSVLENMADAVVVADDPEHVLLYNRAASRMFGRQARGMDSQQWPAHYGLYLPDRITPFPADDLPLARACRGESVDNVEIYVRRQDAPEGLWSSVTGRPLLDREGTVKGGVIVCRDFTGRKLTEEQLTLAAAQLSRNNEELRLHSDELERAKVQAESATQAKSEFLASMSHEIRTPMNGVIGMSRLLLEEDLSTEQRDYAETIYDSSFALLTIINDILDLSRIEAGKLELEIVDMDLPEMVGRVRDLLAPTAAHQGTLIVVTIAPDLPIVVRSDKGRVRQTLLNLAGNALKFSPENGRVEISVSLESSALTPWVRFAVKDTGIGIAEDVQERLFLPFTQANPSIRGRFGGSGLGLSISRNLVEKMGGEIGVQSSIGEGSTFWFRIPLIYTHIAKAPVARTPHSVITSGSPAGQRILVVDDNLVNQKVAGAILHKLGYDFDLAANGKEALVALSLHTYQAVLMDCQMPVMDGFEATKEIRRQEGTSLHTPIIALTAGAMLDDRNRCLLAGMDDFVVKPIDPAQLIIALERAIQDASQGPLPLKESSGDGEKREVLMVTG